MISRMAWTMWMMVLVVLLSSCASEEAYKMATLSMPGVQAPREDYYACTAAAVEDLVPGNKVGHIIGFQPNADGDKAHHMLLEICNDPIKKNGEAWDCLSQGVCNDGSTVIYGWAKNAESFKMPDGVSMSLDPAKTKYVVLQVHYAVPGTSPDNTGLSLKLSEEKTRYDASILTMGVGNLKIPALTAVTHGDANCKSYIQMHPFAFRTHAHQWGYVIKGYHYSATSGKMTEFAAASPQWPQAFYPATNNVTIKPGDYLHARCSYNTINKTVDTYIG